MPLNLPWSNLHIHRQHFVLIIAQDGSNFFIVDSYQCNDVQKLSIDYLKKCNINNIFLFDTQDFNLSDKDIWENMQKKCDIFQNYLTNGTKDLTLFCHDIEKMEYKNVQLENITTSNLLFVFQYILEQKNFKIALQKIENLTRCKIFEETIADLEKSSYLWGKAKQVFIKSLIQKNKNKAFEVSVLLQETREIERRVAQFMLNYNI